VTGSTIFITAHQRLALAAVGIEVVEAPRGISFRRDVVEGTWDLKWRTWMFPDTQAPEVCRSLRDAVLAVGVELPDAGGKA
jgi:hypothetical protein